MEISKKLSERLCSGLALKETQIIDNEYFAYNSLCRSIFRLAVTFELLTFLLELRTATCHFLQRAESCQKSLQNDTAKTKKPQNNMGCHILNYEKIFNAIKYVCL